MQSNCIGIFRQEGNALCDWMLDLPVDLAVHDHTEPLRLIQMGRTISWRVHAAQCAGLLRPTVLNQQQILKRRLRPRLEEMLDLPVDLVIQDHTEPLTLVSKIAREQGEVIQGSFD